MNRVCIVGCGYVGLVSGAGLAEFGNIVTCYDIDTNRINNLNKLVMPIFEPDLKELVEKNIKAGRLGFTDNLSLALKDCDAVFIAVQTPQDDDGNAKLKFLFTAVEDVASKATGNLVVVIKSTVPVGTSKEVLSYIRLKFKERDITASVEVVSNPEFLIEGRAVSTFLNPDRIVIGCKPKGKACELMKSIYKKPSSDGREVVLCTNETAETIKYAANSFLAMKISFINQMALLCQETGADIDTVAKALGSDSRINPRFLKPGPGYGGSCFPKDTKALVRTAEKYGVDMSIIREADDSNENHKKILADIVASVMKKNGYSNLAVWGLAFKAGTGDIRNSPATTMIEKISENNFNISAYDPEAMTEAKKWIKQTGLKVILADDMYKALDKAEALLIVTEWECFKNADITRIANTLKGNVVFDFRNILDPHEIEKAGLKYYGIGRRYETD